MRIIWSKFAAEELKEIFDYYKDIAGKSIAQRLRDKIFNSTRQLRNQPNSGQIEPTLSKLNEDHRYLVRGNYKVIYKKVEEGILITDIFDTRQDPKKINNPERKPSR
ncbi:MAG: type II toxin-antitoxin system RelE/ParE family toxin [Bacteroidetes bacterium]|nr:type II toxin-antitoxin system RelE/ParE family toxin [Bacteroidota bacterium]